MSDYNNEMLRKAREAAVQLLHHPLSHRRAIYGRSGRDKGYQKLDYPDQNMMTAQIAHMRGNANSLEDLRIAELVGALIPVIDDKGNILKELERDYASGGYKPNPDGVHPNKMRAYKAALAGFMADGRTPLPSQIEAAAQGKHHLLTEETKKLFGKVDRRSLGSVTFSGLKKQRGHVTGKFAAVLAAGAAVVAFATPELSHITKPEAAHPQEAVKMDALETSRSALSARPELATLRQKLQKPSGP